MTFLVDVPFVLENNVYSAVVGLCVLYRSVRLRWLILLFRSLG